MSKDSSKDLSAEDRRIAADIAQGKAARQKELAHRAAIKAAQVAAAKRPTNSVG